MEWEPGTLPTMELEQILTDALADLWRDNYRRSQMPGERLRNWRRQVEQAMYCATGNDLEIVRRGGSSRHGNQERG